MQTSKRARNATLCSVLLVGATVLGTTDSQGQTGRQLTPEQASAKAAFDEEIADSVKGMKVDCGIDLAVTTDFETYERSAVATNGGKGGDEGGKGAGGGGKSEGYGIKKKEGDPEEWKRDQQGHGVLSSHRRECAYAIRALAEVCPKKRSPSSTPHYAEVRGIACLMRGFQARQEDDRIEDMVQRNMSFSNGVLTFHTAPSGTPNLSENVHLALRPLADNTSRRNGIQCSGALVCRSGVCSKGVCTACGPEAACSGQTETCGSKGICFHKLTAAEAAREREEQEERNAAREASDAARSDRGSGSNRSAAKKGLGATCASNSECASKICGTLKSPGGNHKCGTKR